MFARVQLTIYQHWFRYWLGTAQATSHCLIRRWLCWFTDLYVSLGLIELKHQWYDSLVIIEIRTDLHISGSWRCLPYWGRDKMDAILQETFSNAFSWMKMLEFRVKFHWILLLSFKLTIFQHWFRYWLAADQAASHYLNQRWLDYQSIYASLCLNE